MLFLMELVCGTCRGNSVKFYNLLIIIQRSILTATLFIEQKNVPPF